MFGHTIDRIEERLAPHSRAVSIAAAIWFWLGIAIQAHFIPLPELPWLPKSAVFWAGVVFNAVWWGYLHPAINARRSQRGANPNMD